MCENRGNAESNHKLHIPAISTTRSFTLNYGSYNFSSKYWPSNYPNYERYTLHVTVARGYVSSFSCSPLPAFQRLKYSIRRLMKPPWKCIFHDSLLAGRRYEIWLGDKTCQTEKLRRGATPNLDTKRSKIDVKWQS